MTIKVKEYNALGRFFFEPLPNYPALDNKPIFSSPTELAKFLISSVPGYTGHNANRLTANVWQITHGERIASERMLQAFAVAAEKKFETHPGVAKKFIDQMNRIAILTAAHSAHKPTGRPKGAAKFVLQGVRIAANETLDHSPIPPDQADKMKDSKTAGAALAFIEAGIFLRKAGIDTHALNVVAERSDTSELKLALYVLGY